MLYSTPPPGSGALLAFALNILQEFNLSLEDDEALLYHRITEAFKWTYGQRSKLGDPLDADITSYVNELVRNLTSEAQAFQTYQQINDTFTVNNASYYGADFYTPEDHGTTHLSILAPNGDAVAVTSTINRRYLNWNNHHSAGLLQCSGGVF